jgi:hypothetical protein
MCPDPQLLSIYVDGELPSPWKEKVEKHSAECPECREKLENFKQLHELFKKDTHISRTFVERVVDEPAEQRTYTEEEMLEAAKNRVWDNMTAKRRYRRNPALWRRRLSVPLPAAAAAALIVALIAVFWLRSPQNINNGFAKQPQASDKIDFIAEEEKIPNIIPVASDLSGVLQSLGIDNSEIIILRLPESKNFSRSGEPAIIRAADYSRRNP